MAAPFDDWVMNLLRLMGYSVQIAQENNDCVVMVKGDRNNIEGV